MLFFEPPFFFGAAGLVECCLFIMVAFNKVNAEKSVPGAIHRTLTPIGRKHFSLFVGKVVLPHNTPYAMEYDNDRIRRRTNHTEIFYWTLFILIYPLINGASFFLRDWRIWPVLLLVGLFLFPAYLLYSRIMGSLFLTQRRR